MDSEPKVANTIREYYEMYVNPLWPQPLPKLTAAEAERAAKRLYRYVFKKAWTGPVAVTSGRNYSYIRSGVLRVNPDKGWTEMVHNLSHSFAYRLDRSTKPHSYQPDRNAGTGLGAPRPYHQRYGDGRIRWRLACGPVQGSGRP